MTSDPGSFDGNGDSNKQPGSNDQFPADPHRSKFQLRASGRGVVSPTEQATLENIFHRMTAVASWSLKHACHYAMAFELDVDSTPLSPLRKLRSQALHEKAIAEARARRLLVGNPIEPAEKWWVYPQQFIQWAASSPILVGYHRADILKQFLKPVAMALSPAAIARKRVLESKSYQCNEFDIACQAIAHFWLDDSDPEDGDRRSEVIQRWINKNFEVDNKALTRIDALIRPDWAKKGGRKPSPHKT